MAEVDSILVDEAPSADETPAADEGYSFDFLNESAPDASDSALALEDDEGHSSDTPSEATTPDANTGPARFDLLRTPLEDLPENLRDMASDAREQQRSLQAEFTRTSQSLSQIEQQRAQEHQQYLEALQRLQQPQTSAQDPYAEITSQLGEEEQGSVDVVRRIAALENETLRTEMAQMREQMGYLNQQASVSQQQAQAVTQQAQAEELTQARAQFPDADFAPHADAIIALRRIINPATTQGYTVAEAYSRLSGEASQTSAQLQQQQTSARSTAQRRLQGASVDGGTPDGGGEISKAEALKAFPDFFE